jgi:MraZ protein
MFLGRYQHNLDDKGRLTIPARYRGLLMDSAYITQGFDQNLMVMPRESFEAISRRVNEKSITDPKARLLRRLIFSYGEQVEIDRAGRILIPQFLREAAGLDSEVIVVGGGDFFEVWSPQHWADQAARLQDSEANADLFIAFDISSG